MYGVQIDALTKKVFVINLLTFSWQKYGCQHDISALTT